MKHGYYIRFVPSLNEYCFYIYTDNSEFGLFVLAGHIFEPGNIQWRVPFHFEPLPECGFEYVCDLEGE